MAKKRSRVVSEGRSAFAKKQWDDPTVGPDGLTFRQRMSAQSRERMVALNARKRAARSDPPAPPAADPPPAVPPTPATPPPPPPAKRERIGRLFR